MNADGWSSTRERAFRVVSSECFDVAIGIIIALNGVAIGIELDNADIPPAFFEVSEAVFLSIFVLELALKVYVFRAAYFRCVYHSLDVLIVVAGVAMATLKVVQSHIDSSVRNLQLLKLARLLRLVRIIRLGTQFRSLWIIVHGLATCMSTIFWTIVLVAIVCYIFAVIAVEFISSNTEIQGIRWDYQGTTVGERFADLRSALISLFEFFAIDKVSEKGFELVQVQPWSAVYLVAFVLLIPIVLLNLVTAVIVEMAITSARKDEEHQRSVELEEWKGVCEELEALFVQMTTDEGKQEEVRPAISEETAQVQQQTSWMGRLKVLAKTQSGLKKKDTVMGVRLTRERLREICSNEVVREKLNLLFAEPAESRRGAEKLLEYWPMLDTDSDGELSLSEFTEGIGRLHRVIQSHSSEGFFWVRLMKELQRMQEQRGQQEQPSAEYFDEAQRALKVQQERLDLQRSMCEQLAGLAQSVQALGCAQHRTQQRVEAIHEAMDLPPMPPASGEWMMGADWAPPGHTRQSSPSPAAWQCCSRISKEAVLDEDAMHL